MLLCLNFFMAYSQLCVAGLDEGWRHNGRWLSDIQPQQYMCVTVFCSKVALSLISHNSRCQIPAEKFARFLQQEHPYLCNFYSGFSVRSLTPRPSLTVFTTQNEPQNVNPSYPTCKMTAYLHAVIGKALRTLMDNNGFSGTKLIGYEHNWNDASAYPVDLVRKSCFWSF